MQRPLSREGITSRQNETAFAPFSGSDMSMNSGCFETLRPPRVFLGGPFSAALRKAPDGLRFADETLRANIESALAAVRSTEVELLSSHVTDGWGEIDYDADFAERDLRWVEYCDTYIALLPEDGEGQPYRTDGTFIEIGYAMATGKDVVLVVDNPENPHWSYFARKLMDSPRVRRANFEELLASPEQVIFGDLFRPEALEARRRVTDVRLWNWLQRRAKVALSVKVGQADLIVHPGVMNPRFSHSPDFLIHFWRIPSDARVLDMGCGSGVAGINALLAGAGELLAVDINPAAVKNTRENVYRNGVQDRARVVVSDGFEHVDGQFDVVLFNPPYWGDKEARSLAERASFDTPGHGFLRSVLSRLRAYLKPQGRCFIAYSDQGDISLLAQLIQEHGLRTVSIHVQRPDRPGFHVRVGWEIAALQ